MARTFHPSMNALARGTVFGAVLIIAGLAWVGYAVQQSPYVTDQNIPREQPIPFSHEHHAGGLAIDCRYCHTSVAESSYAGMPSTKTCMSCHSQIWTGAPMLEPLRRSWEQGTPIAWNRVHQLPQYVNFPHDIHVNKGVGCASCHGRVDEMPLMYQASTLQMQWCLDCHRNPAPNLRPLDEVFNMGWTRAADDPSGHHLMAQYRIRSKQELTECALCHY
jgi:hypothetical protein